MGSEETQEVKCITDLRASIQHTEREMKEWSSRHKYMTDELEKEKNEKKTMIMEKEVMSKTITSLQAKVDGLEAEKKTLLEQISELEKRHSQTTTQLKTATDKCIKFEKEIRETKVIINEFESKVLISQTKHEEASSSSRDTMIKNEELQRENSKLKAELAEEKDKVRSSKKEVQMSTRE